MPALAATLHAQGYLHEIDWRGVRSCTKADGRPKAVRLDIAGPHLGAPSAGPNESIELLAVVVQDARRCRSLNTGYSAQIFVDRLQVMVGHVVIDRPWHDLEQGAIEWR